LLTAGPSATGDESARASIGNWQVRISDADGSFRGAGVVVAHRYVVTCAHVLSRQSDRPTGTFRIDFPRARSEQRSFARVAEDGWFPIIDDFQRDIAVLELDEALENDVALARLGSAERSLGRTALVHGHPEGLHEGSWTETRIIESIGRGERVQLDNAPGAIAPGYSGGGVLDVAAGRVVGIVASTFRRDDRVTAFMIPMEVVAGYWPRLATWLEESGPAEDLVDEAGLRQITELLGERRSMQTADGLSWVADRLSDDVRDRLRAPRPTMADLVRACRIPSELRILTDLVHYRDGATAGRGPIDDLLTRYGVTDVRPSTIPEDLGPNTCEELYGLLMRQQYFLDKRTREVYFAAFAHRVSRARRLEVRLDVTDSATADASALVAECRRIPGAVRMIVADFPFGDRDRREFRDLFLFVEVLCPRQLLTDDERDALLRLLRGVPPRVLLDSHRRVTPVAAEPTATDNAPTLVRRIERYAQHADELPRLFSFVEYVAVAMADRAELLRRWSDVVAARMRLQRHLMTDLRTSIPRPDAGAGGTDSASADTPVLMVELAPDAQAPSERFLLTVALDGGMTLGARHFLAKSESPVPLALIHERLAQLGADVAQELGPRLDELTMEFVLPRSLITEPVDRWVIATMAPEPIGVRFRVFLRSYERVHRKHYWSNWNEKWKVVRQSNPAIGAVTHYIDPGAGAGAEETRAALRGDKLVLASGTPLVPQPRLRPADDYRAALEAGVPYVLWVRDPACAGELREAVEARLAAEPVMDLPKLVSDWRSEEWYDPQPDRGLGSHVSLVACDHDREVPLTSRGLRPPGRIPS
jgi:hypothetical protein